MRLIIYGAGGIGGVVGGHLARAGHDVVLIGRPGHMGAIREHGLRLVTPTGTHILQLPAVTGPGEIDFKPDDAVLFCMKGQNTEEALRDLQKATKDVPVFCLQNGVRNEEIAAQYFPRVYGVMVRVAAVYLTDGEVTAGWDPPGWFIVGRYPEGIDALGEGVEAKLHDAGFITMVTSDVMPYKWGKLMLNLANAIGAISNARWDDVGVIVQSVQREARDILDKAGVRWVSAEDLAREWPEIARPPNASLDTTARSSTWQSLTRNQGSVETEFLNGEIVRLAGKLGSRAPLNEGLLRICQQMATNGELPGKYTPAQLRVQLGLS